ncbi:hypothetical protein B0T20DRAFT_356417, partial [Sordaria brevicollis]
KYKVRDEVIFDIFNYIIGRLYNKFALRFKSFFRIIKANLYIVELILFKNIKVTYVVNIFRVKLYVLRLLS